MKNLSLLLLTSSLVNWGCNSTTDTQTTKQPEKPKKKEQVKAEEPKEEKVEFSPLWASLFEEGAQSTWQETYTITSYTDEQIDEMHDDIPGEVIPSKDVSKRKITLTVMTVVEVSPGLWESTIKTSRKSDLAGKWYTDGKTCWSDRFRRIRGNPVLALPNTPIKTKRNILGNRVNMNVSYNQAKAMWVYFEKSTEGDPVSFCYYFDPNKGLRGYTLLVENHYGDEILEVWKID
jgi:hypothetical protein